MDSCAAQEGRELCGAYRVCIDFPDGPVSQNIPDSFELPDRRRAYLLSFALVYYHPPYTFFWHHLFYLYDGRSNNNT